jgi:hypothetical protein
MEKTILTPWEETAGPLFEIHDTGDFLQGRIGSRLINFPSEMGSKLQEYLGQRISILRTDKDYRIRILHEQEGDRR